MRRRASPLLGGLICLVLASRAGATVVLPADLETIVAGAHDIVRGRVLDVRSEMTAGRRSIHTLVTLAVDEAMKGAPGDTVTFRVPSGQVGRYRRIVVGAPVFRVGEEVVVFLRARAPELPTLLGLGQGVYRVVRASDGRRVVTPPPVSGRAATGGRVVRGDPARVPLDVGAFARIVRAAATEGGR